MKTCLLAETSPLLVEQPCDLLHPDSIEDLKICNRSNYGPRLVPTISFVEDNSPAKAGLVRGKLLGLYKRGRKTQSKRAKKKIKRKNRAKKGEKKRENASKNKEEKPRKRKPRTEQKPRPKFERKSQHCPLFFIIRTEKAGKNQRKTGGSNKKARKLKDSRKEEGPRIKTTRGESASSSSSFLHL